MAMAEIIPDFQAGQRLMAADFCTLVHAVRQLLAVAGIFAQDKRAVRLMGLCSHAGAAVICGGSEPTAVVNEWLWQAGEQVQLVFGGRLSEDGIKLPAVAEGSQVGVHGAVEIEEVGDEWHPQLAVADVLYEMVTWPSADANAAEKENAWHGGLCAGALRRGESGMEHFRPNMWPMPQAPMCILKDSDAIPGVIDVGELCLLPGGDKGYQLLCSTVGGYNVKEEEGSKHHVVIHEFKARLDRWGQLHVKAENLEL